MSPKTPPIQQGLGLKSDTQTEGLEKKNKLLCMIFPFLKTCSMQTYAKIVSKKNKRSRNNCYVDNMCLCFMRGKIAHPYGHGPCLGDFAMDSNRVTKSMSSATKVTHFRPRLGISSVENL